MEEIAENVYIEECFPRVVLGALKLDHGMLIVDSPFRIEDVQSWKSKLSHLGAGRERLLIIMDAHIDRTIMAQAMEIETLAHESTVGIIRNRTASSKSQELEIGPDWTGTELPPGIRLIKPHITFTNEVQVHWEGDPLVISHMSGAHFAGAWLRYDAQKVIFVGDSVVLNQPPFFAKADLTTWIEDLEWLGSDRFKNFKIISGRNGLIQSSSIRTMSALLNEAKERIDELAEEEMPLASVPELADHLLKKINCDPQLRDRYYLRLTRGLEQYIKRHMLNSETDNKGETE